MCMRFMRDRRRSLSGGSDVCEASPAAQCGASGHRHSQRLTFGVQVCGVWCTDELGRERRRPRGQHRLQGCVAQSLELIAKRPAVAPR